MYFSAELPIHGPMDMIAIDRQTVLDLQVLLAETKAELKKVRELLNKEDRPLTITEAAEYLKVSRQQIHYYRTAQEIFVVTYGRNVWYMKSELDNFLKRHTIKRRSA